MKISILSTIANFASFVLVDRLSRPINSKIEHPLFAKGASFSFGKSKIIVQTIIFKFALMNFLLCLLRLKIRNLF
jgi:hypothetical protein